MSGALVSKRTQFTCLCGDAMEGPKAQTGSAMLRAKGTKGCERMAATTSAPRTAPGTVRGATLPPPDHHPYPPIRPTSAISSSRVRKRLSTAGVVPPGGEADYRAQTIDGRQTDRPIDAAQEHPRLHRHGEAVAAAKCFMCQVSFQKL